MPLTPALRSIQMVSNSQCVGRPAACPLGWGSPVYLGAHPTALGTSQSPMRTAPPETSTCRLLSSVVSPRARRAPCCAIQLCVLSQQNVIPARDARPHGQEGTSCPRRHHRHWLLHELYQENLYKQRSNPHPYSTTDKVQNKCLSSIFDVRQDPPLPSQLISSKASALLGLGAPAPPSPAAKVLCAL